MRHDLAKYHRQTSELKSIRNPDEKQRQELEENEQLEQVFHTKLDETYAYKKQISAPLDETKGISNICPVHHCAMKAVVVPINYGMLLPLDSNPPEPLRQREFPYARRWWPGGCVSSDTSPAFAKIYVCPDCGRAEKQWLKACENSHAISRRPSQGSRPNPHP